MGKKPTTAFDRLIGSYYGGAPADVSTNRRVGDLLASYYGQPGAATSDASSARAKQPVSQSLGCDDGEVLSQRRRPGVARSTSLSQDAGAEFIEYVVDGGVSPRANGDRTAPVASDAPVQAAPRSDVTDRPAPPAYAPPPTASLPEPPPTASPPGGSAPSSSLAEDDFTRDLKAIMRGEKLYDKQKGMVDRNASGGGAGGSPPPTSGSQSAHTIFDKIAQSMQYANAYDLGNVELENRFAEFDRVEEERKKAEAARRKAAKTVPPADGPDTSSRPDPDSVDPDRPGTSDFISDLGSMRSSPSRRSAPAVATSLSLELDRRREYSRPFYDTGEHVLLGGNAYDGRLFVGQSPGVAFSYGQIVAMGDLYDTVDDMMKASVAELTRLKTMIASDTSFYSGKKVNKALGVKNEAWDDATGGRFLKLAEDNYEHFSPAHVAMGSAVGTLHGNNQTQWEKYHRRAIQEAQDLWLANPNASVFYERPLITNAFGDHFLTDAFSAGHLINKDVVLDLFKANFFKNYDTLNAAGDDFFERVAKEAWWGMVSYKFSKLETGEGQIDLKIGKVYHPDIDSASMFAKVLIKAAEKEPERVGNLLVKALHDRLNDDGVEVSNDAGDGAWYVPGDGSLMIGKGRLNAANLNKNFGIIRKAVQQSIDDVIGDQTHASNLDFSKFMNGVWRYTPVLTSVGQREVSALIKEYTDPHSATLVKAAADLIHDQLDSMLKIMVDQEHALRPN